MPSETREYSGGLAGEAALPHAGRMSYRPGDAISQDALRGVVARIFPPHLQEEAWTRLEAWPFGHRSLDQPGFVQLVALGLCDGTLEDLTERMADVELDIRDVLFGIQRLHGSEWMAAFLE